MSSNLLRVLSQLGMPRLLVVGDLILDRYTWGDAERISQEAPVILLRSQRQESRLGGAGNVAHMIRALGGQVTLVGIVGADIDGEQLRGHLRQAGIDDQTVLADAGRPTTVKERFIGQVDGRHPHQVLRVDREQRDAVGTEVEARVVRMLQEQLADQDLVLVSDYGKGVCTERVLGWLMAEARRRGIRVLVDPCRTTDYRCYRGATVITPNRQESQLASGGVIREPPDALPLAAQLCRRWDLQAAIITLDADGMALACADGRQGLFPTRRRQVYDITGAGDMVLATIGMCLAAGASYEEAIGLANVAGGLEVERVGVAVITREEILEDILSHATPIDGRRRRLLDRGKQKVLEIDALVKEVEARRRQHQRIVFTNGCFDLLHIGHVTYLQEAASLGDCLIVAINSDDGVRRLKGSGRPLIGQQERAAMLAALEAADYVIIFDEDTPHELLRKIRPDVLVKGGTYDVNGVVGKEVVEAYGGKVCVTGRVEGISTTQLLDRLRETESPAFTGPHHLRAVRSASDTEPSANSLSDSLRRIP